MLAQNLRPRGVRAITTPSAQIEELVKDPFSSCMKCCFPLSGVTKLPKVIDDLSIVLNCGHVLCNKCVHLNDVATVNAGRPVHCQHDFQCSVCGLMSPPLTIPNCVRICERRYLRGSKKEACTCEVCKPEKQPNYKSRLNNIAYCGIHSDTPVRMFCNQCGKHLCDTCVKNHPSEFKSTEHTISLISKENERLEDALFNGGVIHKNLKKLLDEAQTGLETFQEKSKNLKNTMGCFFIAIINAAIGRYCQLNAAIQGEEDKMKALVDCIVNDTNDARRRIEIAHEMDELSRSQVLMPEQCTSDSYKMSAQKIFKDAVVMHNNVIKNVKTVTTHNIQFFSKKTPKETVQAVTSIFSDFTTSNVNVSQRFHLDNISTLLSPTNTIVLEVSDEFLDLQEIDFSTLEEARVMTDNSFSRFKSAMDACGIVGVPLSKLHPSLTPAKVDEKINEAVPAKAPAQQNAQAAAKPTAAASPSPSSSSVEASSSSSSRPNNVVAPTAPIAPAPSRNPLPPNENKAKKQEELLSMIRGASANSSDSVARPELSVSRNEERSRSHSRKSAPFEITVSSISNNSEASIQGSTRSLMQSLMRNGQANQRASSSASSSSSSNHFETAAPPQVTATATAIATPSSAPMVTAQGIRNLMATFQGMDIAPRFMNILYTSDDFRHISSEHQLYALKIAHQLTLSENKRLSDRFTPEERNYFDTITADRLRAGLARLRLAENRGQVLVQPRAPPRPKPSPMMPPPMNPSLHANKMLDPRNMQRMLPVQRMMNNAGVKSLAQMHPTNGSPSNGAGKKSLNTHLPVKVLQVPSDPSKIPPAHRPAFTAQHMAQFNQNRHQQQHQGQGSSSNVSLNSLLQPHIHPHASMQSHNRHSLPTSLHAQMQQQQQPQPQPQPQPQQTPSSSAMVQRPIKQEPNSDPKKKEVSIKQEVVDEDYTGVTVVDDNGIVVRRGQSQHMRASSPDTLPRGMEERLPDYRYAIKPTIKSEHQLTLDDILQRSPPPMALSQHLDNDWQSREEEMASAENGIIRTASDGRLILKLKRSNHAGVEEAPLPPPSAAEEEAEIYDNGSASLMPTVEECRANGEHSPPSSEAAESARTIDEDGTHRWCYVCNDERQDQLHEEKGICTACIRVFHKACAIPKLQVEWSEDDDWKCMLCQKEPPENPEDQGAVDGLTDRERYLCRLVLMKCAATRASSKLVKSYSKKLQDPSNTLDAVSHKLEPNAHQCIKSVEEFIKAVNNVFIGASVGNIKSSEKAIAAEKTWNHYRKAVKKYLPNYKGYVWLYVSLYGMTTHKRKALTALTYGSSPAKKKC